MRLPKAVIVLGAVLLLTACKSATETYTGEEDEGMALSQPATVLTA